MDTTPTPRTDKAAYYMGREGPDRDGERWCDLLNESRAIERDLAAAVAAINDCVNLANGRESEWGDRAENAFNFLHRFLANSPITGATASGASKSSNHETT